jgi:transcriptional regulator with XRE-family HTH domain
LSSFLNNRSVRSKLDTLKMFGRIVRRTRQRAGLTQEELAERADLHRTYIGGIERGERNVALINLVKLARAFRIKPAELLRDLE